MQRETRQSAHPPAKTDRSVPKQEYCSNTKNQHAENVAMCSFFQQGQQKTVPGNCYKASVQDEQKQYTIWDSTPLYEGG